VSLGLKRHSKDNTRSPGLPYFSHRPTGFQDTRARIRHDDHIHSTVLATFCCLLAAAADRYVSLQRNSARWPFLLDILPTIRPGDRVIVADRKASKAALAALGAFLLDQNVPQSLTIDFNGCKLKADESTSPIDLRRIVIGTIANVRLEKFSGEIFRFYRHSRILLANVSVRKCAFWKVPEVFAATRTELRIRNITIRETSLFRSSLFSFVHPSVEIRQISVENVVLNESSLFFTVENSVAVSDFAGQALSGKAAFFFENLGISVFELVRARFRSLDFVDESIFLKSDVFGKAIVSDLIVFDSSGLNFVYGFFDRLTLNSVAISNSNFVDGFLKVRNSGDVFIHRSVLTNLTFLATLMSFRELRNFRLTSSNISHSVQRRNGSSAIDLVKVNSVLISKSLIAHCRVEGEFLALRATNASMRNVSFVSVASPRAGGCVFADRATTLDVEGIVFTGTGDLPIRADGVLKGELHRSVSLVIKVPGWRLGALVQMNVDVCCVWLLLVLFIIAAFPIRRVPRDWRRGNLASLSLTSRS
jgi:hypothetical protein